jgi:hypothetical protein
VVGANRTVVTRLGGEQSALLEKGQGTLLAAGHTFAILGREGSTTCAVARGPPPAAAAAAGAAPGPAPAAPLAAATIDMPPGEDPPDSPKRPRPLPGAGSPAPLDKRQRLGERGGGSGAAGGGPAGREEWLHADCPAALLRVR